MPSDLREMHRRLVLKTHPDKTKVKLHPQLFQAVQDCRSTIKKCIKRKGGSPIPSNNFHVIIPGTTRKMEKITSLRQTTTRKPKPKPAQTNRYKPASKKTTRRPIPIYSSNLQPLSLVLNRIDSESIIPMSGIDTTEFDSGGIAPMSMEIPHIDSKGIAPMSIDMMFH